MPTEVEHEPVRRGRAARAWRGAWPALAVVVGALAALVVGLGQPAGEIRGDVTEHFALAEPGELIETGDRVLLDVEATQDELARVDVVVGTFAGTIDCTLVARLLDGSTEVAAQETDCADLGDNTASTVVSFDPVPGSAGRDYRLELSITPASVVGPVVWETATGVDPVITYYDPVPQMSARVWTVLDRVADYAPAWGSPAAMVALALLFVSALALLAARPRWGLVAVLVLVLVRGLLWAALIPPLQAMDEGAHFANAQFIAEEGRLPSPTLSEPAVGTYSASLAVASEAMHVSSMAPTDRPDFGPDAVARLDVADARVGTDSDGNGPAASYPPGYYGPAALAYLMAPDSTAAQVHAIRLWTVLLGLAGVVVAWLFAGEVMANRPAARAGLVAAVALHPMLTHQSAVVNNDALVILSGFLTLWIGVRLLRTPTAPWFMLGAGAAVGAGMLGKPFGAIAVLPVVIGWLLGKVVHRVRDPKVLLGEPLLSAVGVALTYGVWLVVAAAAGVSTGLGFPRDDADGPRDLVTYLATQFDPQLQEFRGLWVRQYWGNFGWVNTPLPEGVYTALWVAYVAVAAGVLAWVVLWAARWRTRTSVERRLDLQLTVLVVSGIGAILAMYAIEYGYFASFGRTDLLQGRYLLITVPALLAMPALLVERLSRGRWSPTLTTWLVAAAVAAVHVVSILAIVRHYYL